MLTIVLAISGITIVGYLLLILLKLEKLNFFCKIGLSYILGIGVITYLLFLLNLLGIAYTTNTFVTLLLGSIFLLLIPVFLFYDRNTLHIKNFYTRVLQIYKISNKFNSAEKIFSVFLLLISIWTIAYSSYWPVKDWDSIVLYDFRAKSFVNSGFMDEAISYGYFFGYPLLTSLAHTIVYLVGFQYPGIIHSLFFVSLLLISYSFFRNELPRSWALLWTFVLSMSGALIDHALLTYTNLAYTVYLVVGYLFLMEWFTRRKLNYLILSAILVGLSTWTRSAEPFWLIVVVLVAILNLFFKKPSNGFLFAGIVLLFRQPWYLYEKAHAVLIQVPSETAAQAPKSITSFLTLKTLPEVIVYFWNNVVLASITLYIVLLLSIIFISLEWRYFKSRPTAVVMAIILLLNLGAIFCGIFWFSISYSDWVNIGGSATRLSLFINPLIIYLTAYTLAPLCTESIIQFKK